MAHAAPVSAQGPAAFAARDAGGGEDERAEEEVTGLDPAILGTAPDPKHLCCRCRHLLRTPVQTECGHRYCQGCLAGLIRRKETTCARCQEENVFDPELSILDENKVFPDRAAQREIDCLPAHCINAGCGWTGTVKQYWSDHERGCEFSALPCPFFDIGCTAKVSLRDFSQHEEASVPLHLRLLLAQLSRLRSPFAAPRPDRSPLHNGAASPGPASPSSPSFALALAASPPLLSVEQRVRQLEELFERLQLKSGGGGGGGGSGGDGWNDSGLGVSAAALTKRVQPGAGKGGRRKAAQAQAALAQAAQVVEESGSGPVVLARLARVERMLVAFENIAKVLDRETERVGAAQRQAEQQRAAEQQQLQAMHSKVREVERQLAVKDAALAELRGRLLAFEAASFDGVFLWKITGFRHRSQEASDGRNLAFYSPAFYTSQHGYKMCLRLYPNGDGAGRGSHLSLFFVIMKGEHDALLLWPFKYKVTLMLLDQDRREHVIDAFRPDVASSSFQRPTGELNVASGCPLFCPLARLQAPRPAYFREDTIFIRCIVDTSDGV